jgi:rod shape-determining protein MreD
MKGFVLYLGIAILAIAVQSSLLFDGTKPDLLLVLVIFYALRHGQGMGLMYGALTGLLVDAASGFLLGPHMLSKAVAGFCIPVIRRKLFHWDSVTCFLMIAVFSVIDIILVSFCFMTFSGMSFINRPFSISAMQVFLTTISGIILYLPLGYDKNHIRYLKVHGGR